MVATELLKLAMDPEEERKARLKKMVATTHLRLAPETEDERRAGDKCGDILLQCFIISLGLAVKTCLLLHQLPWPLHSLPWLFLVALVTQINPDPSASLQLL